MAHGKIVGSTYYKIEREKDRLRMAGGSWSINLSELDMTKVDTIVFTSEKARYTISTTDALAHGFQRTLGLENKLVVPVKNWKVEYVATRKET